MMRALIFLFLYGALTLLGAFLAVFWGMVAKRRWSVIAGRWSWRRDRYFLLASSVAISSTGLVLVDGGRIVGNLLYGLSPILQRAEAWAIGAGLVLLLIGYGKMVVLADLERDPPNFIWAKLGVAVTLAWFVLSCLISPMVPMYPVAVDAKGHITSQ
jgi:hypothetical protein